MPDLIACCTEPVDASDPDVFFGYYVGPIYTVDGCDGTLVTTREGRFEELDGDSLGQGLPAGWFPCGARPGVTTGGGGGGGGSGSVAQIEFTWQQGNFDDGGSTTTWPDGGALSTLAAERWTPAPIAGSFTTWTCVGMVLVVHNVGVATTGAIVVVLQDDGGNVYGTITIANGTSPDSPGTAKFIRRTTTSSVAAGVGTRLQWVIQDSPTGNDYWVEAYALGVLT